MTSRSDSESRRSPRLVDPFRSEKTMVTVLRTSAGGTAVPRGVPQYPHRRNLSGFSSPQPGQTCTAGKCTARSAAAPDRRVVARIQLADGHDLGARVAVHPEHASLEPVRYRGQLPVAGVQATRDLDARAQQRDVLERLMRRDPDRWVLTGDEPVAVQVHPAPRGG